MWKMSLDLIKQLVTQTQGSTSILWMKLPTLADSGLVKNFLYHSGVMSTVSWVFEDLKFKISEGYDQNWCFPDSAQLAVSV